MRVLLHLLVILILVVTPLLSNFIGLDFEQSKVAFFLIVINLAGLLWLIYLVKNRHKISLKLTLIHKLVVVFMATLAVTSYFGIDFPGSLIGRTPYFQGLLVYLDLYLFYLIVSTINFRTEFMSMAITAGAVIVALQSIVNLDWLHSRPIGTFGQADLYAGFLILALPFIYDLYKRVTSHLSQACLGLALAVVVASILISRSRAGLIIIGLIGAIWLARLMRSKKIFFIWPIILIGAIVVGLVTFQVFETDIRQPTSQQWLIDNSPEKRIFIWPVMISFIKERPLLGYGLENIELVFSNFKQETVPLMAYFGVKNLNIDRAHSYSLDLLFYGGIGALISWLAVLIVAIKKSRRPVFLNFLLIYLIWSQLEVQSIVHLILFWGVIGVIDVDNPDPKVY